MVRDRRDTAGHALQSPFDRNRHLLFDFLGRLPGNQRDDDDLGFGDVGIGFHLELLERPPARQGQHKRQQHDRKPLAQSKIQQCRKHINALRWQKGAWPR